MKIPVSDRDKQMLGVLLLFFLALGYYYLILVPLEKLSGSTGRELRAKQDAFAITQVNISRFQSWQDYCATLGGRLAAIRSMVKAPSLDKSATARMEAIMQAANQARASVENLKPISTSTTLPDGTASTTLNRFVIDGNCSFDSFMQLLKGLYGMKLVQFTLSAGGGSQDSLRFYLVMESIPKMKLDLPLPKNTKTALPNYNIKHNLFTLKQNRAAEQSKASSNASKIKVLTPEEIREEKIEQLQERLNGLKLEGTAKLGEEKLAVIADPQDNESTYRSYRIGDTVRGVKIVRITEYEVELKDEENISCVLQIPVPAELQPEQASTDGRSFQRGSWFGSLAKSGRQDIVVSFRES